MSDQGTPQRPERVAQALSEGDTALAAGRGAEAVVLFSRALAELPGDGELLWRLGAALIAAGRPADALPPLRQAIRDGHFAPEALVQLAEAETKLGRWARATVALRRAARLSPNWIEARLRYGAALLRLGKVSAAMTESEAAAALDSASPDAARLYGTTLYRLRRFGDAVVQFQAWVKARPEEALAHYYFGRARLRNGNRRAAYFCIKRALQLDSFLVRADLLMAQMTLERSNIYSAQLHLQHAVESRPDSATLRAMLAEVQLRRGLTDEAKHNAEAALARDPQSRIARIVLARCQIVPVAQAELPLNRADEDDAVEPEVEEETVRQQPVRPVGGSSVPVSDRGDYPAMPVGGGAAAMAAPAAWTDFTVPSISLLDHLLIIRALILRELKLSYRHSPFGLLLEFSRPVVVVVAHYYWFILDNKPVPAGIPMELFVLGGFSIYFSFSYPYLAVLASAKRAANIVGIPGVTRMHVRVAKILRFLLGNLMFCYMAPLGMRLLGDTDVGPPNLLLTLPLFGLAGAIALGFGLCVNCLTRFVPFLDPLAHQLRWAIFITSGIYFSITEQKLILAETFWYNPFVHLLEFQRHSYWPGYPLGLVNLWYPALIATIVMIMGLTLNRITRYAAPHA